MTAKASRENVVEVVEIKFGYANREVLKGLSLTIPRGKVVAILGASGCGKTSLLRMIGGQLRPKRGHVKVDGQVVHRLSREKLYLLRRRMGMMFQVSGLFRDLNVYENIAFPMREHTALPEGLIRQLVLMKLNAVGLRGAYGLMPGDLSGGMSRRVALARAIAMDPVLAMYDEPFAGLDPKARRLLRLRWNALLCACLPDRRISPRVKNRQHDNSICFGSVEHRVGKTACLNTANLAVFDRKSLGMI